MRWAESPSANGYQVKPNQQLTAARTVIGIPVHGEAATRN